MSEREETYCVDCPACVSNAKEEQAALGLRCRICLASFDELWPVQSEVRPDLCRRCASAAPPKQGLGATYGRFNPTVGGTTAEKPGETP